MIDRITHTQDRLLDRLRDRRALQAAGQPGTARDFSALDGAGYSLVVTFCRTGEPVATPMWFGLDRGRVYVRTLADSAKVKRLSRDPHVRVAPCNIRGKPTGPFAEGRGRILSLDESAPAQRALDVRYGRRRLVYEALGTRLGVRAVYLELSPDRLLGGARRGERSEPCPDEESDLQPLALDEAQPVALDEVQRIAHVGSWSWDTETARATCSAETYRIFGRDPRQGPESSEELFAYVHPDDFRRVAAGYLELFGGGPSFELDYRIVREDGALRTVHVRGRRDPLCATRYVGTLQDVTELRQAELDARRERDYAATITRSMREGFLLTRDEVILEVNDALCGLTGFTRDELLGAHTPFPFWAPDATDAIARLHQPAGERDEFEATYVRKDGTHFEASITTVAARAPDGELIGLVTTIRDISEQKRHETELKRLATQDPLTGLANHRAFHERLAVEVSRAQRHGRPLSVAVLDLDHFKEVNDQHGHPTGDRVLRETSERLRHLVRDGELLARVGGEEFAWILPDADGPGAFAAAERARDAIGASPFLQVGKLTLSAGVCELAAAGSAQHLYRLADQALYWAKQHGRNQTARYVAEPAASAPSRRGSAKRER